MTKKLLTVFIAMVILAMTGCSSGVSQAEYDAVVAERDAALAQNEALRESLQMQGQEVPAEIGTVPAEGNIADLLEIETVEWEKVFTTRGEYYCDILVTNKSNQLVEATFSVKFFDASGNVIGVQNRTTEALAPGMTHHLSAKNESPYAYAEVTITSAQVDERYKGGMENVKCTDYSVNGTKVIYEVTNNGNAPVSFVNATVLFYNGNKVVDYGFAYAIDSDSELKPGATLMAEVSTKEPFTSYRIFYYGRIDE